MYLLSQYEGRLKRPKSRKVIFESQISVTAVIGANIIFILCRTTEAFHLLDKLVKLYKESNCIYFGVSGAHCQ